jgi:integrase/recombinase XerC/integrase/recombinase XerD
LDEKKEPHLLEDDRISVLQKVFQKHIQLFKKTAEKEMNCKTGTINLTIHHFGWSRFSGWISSKIICTSEYTLWFRSKNKVLFSSVGSI